MGLMPDDGDLRARLLDEIYRLPSTAHPGDDELQAAHFIRTRYYWPGWTHISTDVRTNATSASELNTVKTRHQDCCNHFPVPRGPS
jgi:hypothetical protein